MGEIREKLANMFSKIMAGTVTREEGTMLINALVREDQIETMKELSSLMENPPPGVFPKTILHTVSLTRNKAFKNLMFASLGHKNEDVAILAAQELGKLKTADAKNVLIEHMKSEIYHVRKASAEALVKDFDDGVDILKTTILTNPEPFFRATYTHALLKAGKKGMEALLELLNSGSAEAVIPAIEALCIAGTLLDSASIPRIFDALMLAGDKGDSTLITEILRLVGSLRGRAKGFEGYVMAFSDHPFENVREMAANVLKQIKAS
jgi:HEAT repeat protein